MKPISGGEWVVIPALPQTIKTGFLGAMIILEIRREKPDCVGCEHQRRRPACESPQSDQHPCYSHTGSTLVESATCQISTL